MLPSSKPLLCYVTDRRSLSATRGEAELLAAIERVAAAGVDWIQIREKDLPGARLAALARAALGCLSPHTRVLVNDRLDVALATGAGGVHLGEESLPAEKVVRWLRTAAGRELSPPKFLVGVSCHALEAARAAEQAGASYVFFGPVFATPSKAAYGAPQGLERLAKVCRTVHIPVLAIGGITAENAAPCLAAGARGLAAIRLFQDAANLSETLRGLRLAAAAPGNS